MQALMANIHKLCFTVIHLFYVRSPSIHNLYAFLLLTKEEIITANKMIKVVTFLDAFYDFYEMTFMEITNLKRHKYVFVRTCYQI